MRVECDVKAVLIKTAKGLHGSTQADHEAWLKFKRNLDTMKEGSWLRIEWARPRNPKHHRKLFALLHLIVENSETYDTIEKALVAVKLMAGYCDVHVCPKTNKFVQIPKSIAFESMGQDEFEVFYSAALDGVLKYVLPHIDSARADQLLDMIISGWA